MHQKPDNITEHQQKGHQHWTHFFKSLDMLNDKVGISEVWEQVWQFTSSHLGGSAENLHSLSHSSLSCS